MRYIFVYGDGVEREKKKELLKLIKYNNNNPIFFHFPFYFLCVRKALYDSEIIGDENTMKNIIELHFYFIYTSETFFFLK